MNDRGILSTASQILSHGSYVSHITLNFIVIVTVKQSKSMQKPIMQTQGNMCKKKCKNRSIKPCSAVEWCTKYLASITREGYTGDTLWMCVFKTAQTLTSPNTPNLEEEKINHIRKLHCDISTLNQKSL